MSFILDALKKSENDRQRQGGPALFEVRVAPPRSGFPTWAIALLALLAVNLAIVGWMMLRRPAAAATPPMQAATVAPAAAVPPPPAQPAVVAPPVAQAAAPPISAPPAPTQLGSQPPQQQAPALTAQASQGTGTPQPQQAPAPEERFANTEGGNPDDYAPASEPSRDGPFGHVRRGLDNGLMTYEEAATKNTIPPLHMDLHVYAPDPRKRFVLVNAKRLYEGESLPEGVKVDSITSDGAILSYRGVQFMMERE